MVGAFKKNEGVSIVPSSLQILKGTWAAVHGDWEITNSTDITSQCEVTWGEGNKSYVISLGDIAADEGIRIRYNAVTEYDMVDGEVIRNDATLTGTEIRNYNASANATFYEAGGSAEGYVYSIRLHKEDEDGNSLAGAVFEVTRQASGQVVGRITTGRDGQEETVLTSSTGREAGRLSSGSLSTISITCRPQASAKYGKASCIMITSRPAGF